MNKKDRHVIGYLLFRDLSIESANALSGHFAYGIPSITGFKGAFHAMSRKLLEQSPLDATRVSLRGLMVINHSYQIHASRNQSFREYNFFQRKPVVSTLSEYKKMEVGTPPSITQEAMISLRMSFLVEVVCDRAFQNRTQQALVDAASRIVQQQRMAGGNVVPFTDPNTVQFVKRDDLDDLIYKIPRGFVLVSAQHEFNLLMQDYPDMSPTDILIETSSVYSEPTAHESGQITWHTDRIGSEYGRLVPIMAGYHGISPKFNKGLLENSRSNELDSQYVESVYSLGKWASPQQLMLSDGFDSAFWYYDYQPDKSLYLITTNPPKELSV